MGAAHDEERDHPTPDTPRQTEPPRPSCQASSSPESLVDADEAAALALAFEAVADPTRLRLLNFIARHVRGEACLCDLTAAFDLSSPRIGDHLAVLERAGLIAADRRGSWMYYRIVPAAVAALSDTLSPITPAPHEESVSATDLAPSRGEDPPADRTAASCPDGGPARTEESS